MKKNELNTILYVSLGIIVLIFVLGFITSILSYVFGYGNGYGMMGGGMMTGMMGFGMILFLIPLIGIIYFVYWIFNRDEDPVRLEKRTNHNNPAIEDLDRRYAKGDLTRDQYLTMKEDLHKTC